MASINIVNPTIVSINNNPKENSDVQLLKKTSIVSTNNTPANKNKKAVFGNHNNGITTPSANATKVISTPVAKPKSNNVLFAPAASGVVSISKKGAIKTAPQEKELIASGSVVENVIEEEREDELLLLDPSNVNHQAQCEESQPCNTTTINDQSATEAQIESESTTTSNTIKVEIKYRYSAKELLAMRSLFVTRLPGVEYVENHQKEIVVPVSQSAPVTPYVYFPKTPNTHPQYPHSHHQSYHSVFSPQMSPFKVTNGFTSPFVLPTLVSPPQNGQLLNSAKKGLGPIPFSLPMVNQPTYALPTVGQLPVNRNIKSPISSSKLTGPNSAKKQPIGNRSATKKQQAVSVTNSPQVVKQVVTTDSNESTSEEASAIANAVVTDPTDPAEPTNKDLKKPLREQDPKRLQARQRQIDIGKMTDGYLNYLKSISKSKRKQSDPKTPNKNQICSKRSWDGQVRKWRRLLHKYDPTPNKLDFDDVALDKELADAQESEESNDEEFDVVEESDHEVEQEQSSTDDQTVPSSPISTTMFAPNIYAQLSPDFLKK
eukprot:gene9189-11263_t